MPWNQESPMNQRIKLVADWLSGNFTKSVSERALQVA
jgi:peroxiredoxin